MGTNKRMGEGDTKSDHHHAYKQRLAQALMKWRQQTPTFDATAGAVFHEVFNHPDYQNASPAQQRAWEQGWAQALYAIEERQPLDTFYFPGLDLRQLCAAGRLLDVGCYLGGKSVRWLEKYAGRQLVGVDMPGPHLPAASRFAAGRHAQAAFSAGRAEQLPFAGSTFDIVVCVHTLEHVQDVAAAVRECWRVLKREGYFILTFPPFYYPVGHHLDLVTRTPGLHWLFDYTTLLRAYFALLNERGDAARWYRRATEQPLPGEKGYSLNGMGARRFHQLLQQRYDTGTEPEGSSGWRIVYDGFRDQRGSYSRHPIRWVLDHVIKPLGWPCLREIFEIAYVLQKV